MPRPTVNAVLLDILHRMPGESFTVAEATAAYRQHPATRHSTHKAAWQFVQRNLQRLIKLGTLENSPDRDGALRWVNLAANSSGAPTSLVSSSQEGDSGSSTGNPYNACRPPGLVARLEQHKSDMLCALGEVEEYKVLSTQFPALRKDIQSHYEQALERSNLLLGKIKAVESLLPVQHDAHA